VLPVEISARLANVLSTTLISGLAIAILDPGTDTVPSMIAALPIRMTLLGASGSSAAIEVAAIANAAKAMSSVDLVKAVGLRLPAVMALCRKLEFGSESGD